MPAPQPGSVVNGYTFLGGNPNDQSAWREASAGEAAADKARGTQLGRGQGLQQVNRGAQFDQASALQNQANTAYNALGQHGTGPFTDWSLGISRFLGDDKNARAMGAMERVSGKAALADAQDMKGALSDKDVAFLKSMTYGLGHSTGENLDVARAQEWAAQKTKSYLLSRSRWEKQLGSFDARDAQGRNFDDVWAEYSSRVYPQPMPGETGRYRPNTGQQQTAAAAKQRDPKTAKLYDKYGLE